MKGRDGDLQKHHRGMKPWRKKKTAKSNKQRIISAHYALLYRCRARAYLSYHILLLAYLAFSAIFFHLSLIPA